MTVTEICELARSKKLLFAEWLINITSDQGELLLSSVRDALQYENGRGEHLDTKGNWILAACLAGLASVAGVAKPLVDGLHGWGQKVIFTAVVLIVLALFAAIIFVLWGIRIKAAWFGPRPEIIFRQDILAAEERYLYRHLILHYTEALIANSWVSEIKARKLMCAQAFLVAALFLAVLIGLGRAFVSLPTSPTSPAALPSTTSTR